MLSSTEQWGKCYAFCAHTRRTRSLSRLRLSKFLFFLPEKVLTSNNIPMYSSLLLSCTKRNLRFLAQYSICAAVEMNKKHFKQCALSETNKVAKKCILTMDALRQLACFWNVSSPFTHNDNATIYSDRYFLMPLRSLLCLLRYTKKIFLLFSLFFLFLDSFLSCMWYVIW